MTKEQLKTLLDEERFKNKRLVAVNDIAIDALNSLAAGLGRRRDGTWSAAYLAADELAKIAKLANK